MKEQPTRLGRLLLSKRGDKSRAQFARDLDLSYTFVREMEAGNRFPSEGTIPGLASSLGVQPGYLAYLVYCDRSPLLADYLECWDPLLTAGPNHRTGTNGTGHAPGSSTAHGVEAPRPAIPSEAFARRGEE